MSKRGRVRERGKRRAHHTNNPSSFLVMCGGVCGVCVMVCVCGGVCVMVCVCDGVMVCVCDGVMVCVCVRDGVCAGV